MGVLKRSKVLMVIAVVIFSFAFASDISTVLNRLARGVADEETISKLRSLVRLDPSALAWWVWLGYAHSLRQEWAEAKEAYRQAQLLKAKPSFAWFPPTLPVSWLDEHGSLRPLTINGTTVWQSPVVFCEPRFAVDPKHGDKFIKVVFVYGSGEQSGEAQQLSHWMVQSGELPEHLTDVPSVFAASLKLFSERLGTIVKFPVKAWLFARGDGSAFSFEGNTLFYGSLPNDRWAWWLKAAHEAGHHAVPAYGEFEGLHEPYSGGFLGERLFAVWLWDEGQAGLMGDPKLQRDLKDYLLKTVSAEIVRAQQWLLQSRRDEETPKMQTFLGICLYIERICGWEILRDVMASAPNSSWQGFQTGLEKAFAEHLEGRLTIRLNSPDANTPLSSFDVSALSSGLVAPSIQLAWWLLEGAFQCEVEVQGKGKLQVRWGDSQVAEWNIKTSEPQKFSCVFVNPFSGWQRLRFWWLSGSGKILSVTFKKAINIQKGRDEKWFPNTESKEP